MHLCHLDVDTAIASNQKQYRSRSTQIQPSQRIWDTAESTAISFMKRRKELKSSKERFRNDYAMSSRESVCKILTSRQDDHLVTR